jgi:hypothetical protein
MHGPHDGHGLAGGQRDSRVLVFSQRRLARPLWHVTQYEFEDVLCALDDVDLLAPEPVPHPGTSRATRRLGNGTAVRLGLRRPWTPCHMPQIPRTPITAEHDLFFAVFHYPFQLPYLRRLTGWRRRCTRAACLIIEMWREDLDEFADFLAMLRDFDVVYVLNPAMVPELRARGIDARFLPTAVDALTFSPLPTPPRRVVTAYNYGRRSEVTHRALVELAATEGIHYLYDTTTSGLVKDHREHRALLANLMKRAEFFFTYGLHEGPPKMGTVQHNISTRYFEGAAGGAVMLGSRPGFREFDECFDWPDAVIPLPYECREIADVLADLRRQPERLAQARFHNVRNSLLRHDWSARWDRVLQDAGLATTPAGRERRAELERQADLLTPEMLGGPLARGLSLPRPKRDTAVRPALSAGGTGDRKRALH